MGLYEYGQRSHGYVQDCMPHTVETRQLCPVFVNGLQVGAFLLVETTKIERFHYQFLTASAASKIYTDLVKQYTVTRTETWVNGTAKTVNGVTTTEYTQSTRTVEKCIASIDSSHDPTTGAWTVTVSVNDTTQAVTA